MYVRTQSYRKSTLLPSSLKCSWKKHQRDRSEKKLLKEFERDLKETAAKAKEVWSDLHVDGAGVRCINVTSCVRYTEEKPAATPF